MLTFHFPQRLNSYIEDNSHYHCLQLYSNSSNTGPASNTCNIIMKWNVKAPNSKPSPAKEMHLKRQISYKFSSNITERWSVFIPTFFLLLCIRPRSHFIWHYEQMGPFSSLASLKVQLLTPHPLSHCRDKWRLTCLQKDCLSNTW